MLVKLYLKLLSLAVLCPYKRRVAHFYFQGGKYSKKTA